MYVAYMETQTFPEEEQRNLDTLESNLPNRQALARAQDFVAENSSLVWTGVALVGVVATCLVTRLFGRR
jgi:hypothetical protein